MHYTEVLSTLRSNKERRLKGDTISIPWSLPRLSQVLPGVEQGRYTLISASPKGGKTSLADFLYVFQPIEWIIKNPTSDISLKIFYFSLEVSSQQKILSTMSYKLYKDYNVVISPQKLSSVFANYILDDQVEAIISSDEFQTWFKQFESMVTFIDNMRSPYQIFKTVKDYAEHPDNGSYTFKTIPWQNEDGTYTTRKVRNQYVPVRPNEYVIVIIDHISLLQPEKEHTLHQSISKMSSEYCLEMRDKWNYIPVVVQQQTADSSRAQFTMRGDTIIDKIKPDMEGLADNKYTARDVDLMISLFNPHRYNIRNYEDIDLTRLPDNHREFMINLNRNGISSASIQLFFLGSSSYFEELPTNINEFDYANYQSILSTTK